MKLLILISFILFSILEKAQTYEPVNSTTMEELESHHLGFASVDLENENESDSGYGSPAPSYDEPTGSGMDSMLSSVSSTWFYSQPYRLSQINALCINQFY